MCFIVESVLFDVVIVSVILMNIVVFVFYYYGIDKLFENVLDVCNMVCENVYILIILIE